MPDQLLNLLKLFLLLLLYLFFLRVLRAVWAEVNPPQVGKATPKPKRKRRSRKIPAKGKHAAPVLRLLAPPELKGRTYPVAQEITLGRAAGCQVTIDDTYASQLHARVYITDGATWVEDLGSTNGTHVNGRRLAAPVQLATGDRLQIGSTVFEAQ